MTLLDLTNPDTSELIYKISKFPDGQQTIDLTDYIHRFFDDGVQMGSYIIEVGDNPTIMWEMFI